MNCHYCGVKVICTEEGDGIVVLAGLINRAFHGGCYQAYAGADDMINREDDFDIECED
jgi:hypothetical protein